MSEYVRKYKKEEKRYEKSVRIFASDYDKYILNQRRKGNTASYYPAPEYFLKKNNIPDFKSDFGELWTKYRLTGLHSDWDLRLLRINSNVREVIL